MQKLNHPNIIKFYTSFVDNDNLFILMEYAQHGDLYRLIKEQRAKKKYISEKDLWNFAKQILQGVEYLHSIDVLHRDIKCLNIFLSDNKQIKLGDMGVSDILARGSHMHRQRVGTPLYLSPELIKNYQYDHKIDIWAVGCALYHLSQLEPPFQGENLVTLGAAITSKKPKSVPHVYSKQFSQFIETLMMKMPNQRPSAAEALALIPLAIMKNNSNYQSEQVTINKNPDTTRS